MASSSPANRRPHGDGVRGSYPIVGGEKEGFGINSEKNKLKVSSEGENAILSPTPSERGFQPSASDPASHLTSPLSHPEINGAPPIAFNLGGQPGSIPSAQRGSQRFSSPSTGLGPTWAVVPSLRGIKYIDSSLKTPIMTPRTAAYIRRKAQEAQLSARTTAGSVATSRTQATTGISPLTFRDFPDSLDKEEEPKTPLPLPVKDEKTIGQATERVRRQPCTGPAYTAVHTPPYIIPSWAYGEVQNLFDPAGQLQPLSPLEQKLVLSNLINMGQRQCLGLSGVPHYYQYPYRAMAAGSYLEDYPVPPPKGGHSFDEDPLLRSVLTPQDNFPYLRDAATYYGQPLNYTHNDMMLDNVMVATGAKQYCPDTKPTYADIPNFGRVQGIYMRQQDGTVYPLITLPKMTPYDMFKVLDRMERRRSRKQETQPIWWKRLCCAVPDTMEP